MDDVRWHARPTLRHPTLIAAFTGWNDAGDSASSAVRTLIDGWDAHPLATIDPEDYTDFATTRPHVRLSDGLTREIVWPTVSAWYASRDDKDVVLVLGPEPSLRWRQFCEQLTGLASEVGTALVITLGALLADVPHTRAVNLIGTATDQELIDRYELTRSRYEGPTGIVGVLQDACTQAGLPAASLWAAVPAYASQLPSPKATLALVRRACEVIGVSAPEDELADRVDDYVARVDAIVADDDDLIGYVQRLESMSDAGMDLDDLDEDDEDEDEDDSVGGEAAEEPLDAGGGDRLIEEVERFLRDQGPA